MNIPPYTASPPTSQRATDVATLSQAQSPHLPLHRSGLIRQHASNCFAFLDVPERRWARDYVLGWRSGPCADDLSAVIRGVGDNCAPPFEMLAVGPDPSGTCMLANELVWLWHPLSRAGGVTVGVCIERLSAVDGFTSFSFPSMPNDADGKVRLMGRFAMLEETGECVSVSTSSTSPAMFPAAEMTQVTSMRHDCGAYLVTLSYALTSLLPALWRPTSVEDLTDAIILCEAASFRRARCSICGNLPLDGRACMCTAMADFNARQATDTDWNHSLARRLHGGGGGRGCIGGNGRFIGEFTGLSQLYVRSGPGAETKQMFLPSLNIRNSFMDDASGRGLAHEMQLLAIRSIVNSVPRLCSLERPPELLSDSGLRTTEKETDIVDAAVEAAMRQPVGQDLGNDPSICRHPLSSAHSQSASGGETVAYSRDGGSSSLSSDPSQETKSPSYSLESDGCGRPDVIWDGRIPTKAVAAGRGMVTGAWQREKIHGPIAHQGDAAELPSDEIISAEQILEERRRKNRQSARNSDARRKEGRKILERDVKFVRERVVELEARKLALETENEELKRRLAVDFVAL